MSYEGLTAAEIEELKTAFEKAKKINNEHLKLKAAFEKTEEINNKHLKGYIYDSLVYRYIRARECMADFNYFMDNQKNNKNPHSWNWHHQQANRDIMRFCQILDEAIGEHD